MSQKDDLFRQKAHVMIAGKCNISLVQRKMLRAHLRLKARYARNLLATMLA